MPEFRCDEEWWNSLDPEQQETWLDFAENCGAKRKPLFCGRNTEYDPPLACIAHVSAKLTDDDLIDILGLDKE